MDAPDFLKLFSTDTAAPTDTGYWFTPRVAALFWLAGEQILNQDAAGTASDHVRRLMKDIQGGDEPLPFSDEEQQAVDRILRVIEVSYGDLAVRPRLSDLPLTFADAQPLTARLMGLSEVLRGETPSSESGTT